MRVFKKHITRYVNADGRQVPKGTPGAHKIKEKSAKWYGRVPGTAKPIPLCHNKSAAEILLNELVKKAEQRKAGIGDPFEEQHRRPLTEHLEDYHKHLAAEGNGDAHLNKTCAKIKTILRGCQFAFIPDLDDEKVALFLHELRRDPPRPPLPDAQEWFTGHELVAALGGKRPPQLARIIHREGLTARGDGKARRYSRETVERLQELLCRGMGICTSNAYATAIKSFSRWLLVKKRTGHDRIAGLSKLKADIDRRHERRALPENELQALLDAAQKSTATVEELSGMDRALLYTLAMATGFRASELRSLRPLSFDLDTDRPTVTVKAGYSKNREEAIQPLPLDVAAAFRVYLADRPPRQTLWPGQWHLNAAKMLRHDLDAASISYRDAEGRVFDFHSLRHSYITLLSRCDVAPRVAQGLARHSTIDLTMNVYTHLQMHDLAGAVARLPALIPGGHRHEAGRLRQTGTDASTPANTSCSPVAQTHATERDSLTTTERASLVGAQTERKTKPLVLQGVEGGCERLIVLDRKLPGQDSNLDKESQNLLCYRYTTG